MPSFAIRTPAAVALACGLLLGAAGGGWAQEIPGGDAREDSQPAPASGAQTSLQASIGFVGAAPVGEFERFVPDGAGGFSGQLDVGLGGSPLSLGGEIAWLLYGEESRTVSLAPLIPEVPEASTTVGTTNAMLTLHARLRAQPRTGRFRPYVDGLVGVADIYTKSDVAGGEVCVSGGYGLSCEQGSLGSRTQSRDFVPSYGVGFGFMYGFSARERAPRLDFAVRYLNGGTARYLTEGAVRPDGEDLVLVFSHSRTDMVVVYLGVAFGR